MGTIVTIIIIYLIGVVSAYFVVGFYDYLSNDLDYDTQLNMIWTSWFSAIICLIAIVVWLIGNKIPKPGDGVRKLLRKK